MDRRETFSSVDDRHTYLELLRKNLADTQVGLLGWCLMSNDVHLIAVPERSDSLSVLLRRVHGRYAQYYNARIGRIGHLWQNRFFACVLAPDHLWTALAYIERNPLRATLVERAEHYIWSSAVAHVTGRDGTGLLDMEWWHKADRRGWREVLARPVRALDPENSSEAESLAQIRACTYAGRPFGDEAFVSEMSKLFQRHWTPGRPESATDSSKQYQLFRPLN